MKFLALLVAIVVSITNFPQEKIAGQDFEISFNIVNAIPNSMYYGKALGGENFTKVDTGNSGGWNQQNASWSSMPQFQSNSEGSVSGTIKAKFDPLTVAGPQQLKIRIRKIDDDVNYDSEIVSINISTPSPTNSPTQKPTSPTPTQISPPTPNPTLNPTPKLIATKPQSPNPTQSSTQTQEPEVLAEKTDVSDVEFDNNSKPKSNLLILPIIIIVVGAGLICVSGYLTYKIRYNSTHEQKN